MLPSLEVYRPDDSVAPDLAVPAPDIAAPVPAPLAPGPLAPVVASALRTRIAAIDHTACDAGDEDLFFVCDLGEIKAAYAQWQRELPMVTPFYAVKCNPTPEVLRLLGELGTNFDCASKAEIDAVRGLGYHPSRIVYANPCKTTLFIRHAATVGVNLTTVDNAHELTKLSRFHPGCGVLVRIATDDETAQCRLLTKFGCTVGTAITELLPRARELGLEIRGVAFHVGLGATDFDLIRKAVRDARAVFDAAAEYGFAADVLDIGGGFERALFAELARVVRLLLATYFGGSLVKVIAEPGRFMVLNAFTLATHVIARRDVGDAAMIYVNDGVYGNMNCILFDHQHPVPHVLTHHHKFYDKEVGPGFQCSIWGPTCDGLDCVAAEATLACPVTVGDWLYFPHLGAYTSAASTSFNGFLAAASTVYVDSSKE